MLARNHIKVNLSATVYLWALLPVVNNMLFVGTMWDGVFVIIGTILVDIDTKFGLINAKNPILIGAKGAAKYLAALVSLIVIVLLGFFVGKFTYGSLGKIPLVVLLVGLFIMLPLAFSIDKKLMNFLYGLFYRCVFVGGGLASLYLIDNKVLAISLSVICFFVAVSNHRGVFHSLDGMIFFNVLVFFIFRELGIGEYFRPFAFGYLVHLFLGDIFTPTGILVSYFIPALTKQKEKRLSLNLFTTGSEVERLYAFLAVLFAVVLWLNKSFLGVF